MNHYKSYMDRVAVSDALHTRLLNLEEQHTPRRKPVRWQTYAAAAACGLFLVGVGAFGLSRRIPGRQMPPDSDPVQCAAPSAPSTAEAIDLAPEDLNEVEPGMKTIEGYETRETRAGVGVAVYHVLPWIDYGTENNVAALDWTLPDGATERDLTAGEITALLGGADGVNVHLDWSAYELTGWAAWYADGSFWGAYLQGYKGPMDHFEFAVTSGNLPPTCIIFGDSVEQEVWGVTVIADKYDGEVGCARRVSFMKDDYGYRFDLTATGEAEDAEKLVSRAVTYVAVGDGLDFTPFTGEETPASADPVPSASFLPEGGTDTPAFDPSAGDGASAPSVGPAE